jgi:gluconolactonase
MTTKAVLAILAASTLLSGQARAQPPGPARGAASQSCIPNAADGMARPLGAGQDRPQPPRNLAIAAIPGVVAAGGFWTKVWQQGGNSADGIIADKDGGVLFAQEDYDSALKLDRADKLAAPISRIGGLSSLSADRQGRLYGVTRTERPESTKPGKESITNSVLLLTPERKVVTDKWADGSRLTVRPNDLAADSHGGAYFTVGCLYYASPKGVTVASDNLRTNGVIFSPDDKVLYVTNGGGIVAFDVTAPGVLANRRDFAALPTGSNGDGIVVDAEGRLYVTAGPGVHVYDKAGAYLGLIPTPRAVIAIAFAGADRNTLYVVGSGADDHKGQAIHEGPQRTAATIYKLPVLAKGLKDRAK